VNTPTTSALTPLERALVSALVAAVLKRLKKTSACAG
jgi:hypothetical protein